MVLVVLASFLNEAKPSDGCWPSVATLVKKIGATDRTIQSCLIKLEAAGHISRLPRKGRVTIYYVHPILPRKSFGGQDAPSAARSLKVENEFSGLPRKNCRQTPETPSADQESSKKEKGGKVESPVRRASRQESQNDCQPPTEPVLAPECESEIFRPMRDALLKKMGPSAYSIFLNHVRFEEVEGVPGKDRRVMRVSYVRKGSIILMDGGRVGLVTAEAKAIGFTEVW